MVEIALLGWRREGEIHGQRIDGSTEIERYQST
jgi:hypothetical protein